MEQQTTRQRYAQEGRCVRCGQERDTSAKLCEGCRELSRAEVARRRKKLAKEGRCQRCGQPRDGPTQLCHNCRKKGRTRMIVMRQQWAAAGICLQCGTRPMRPGKKNCHECAQAESQNAKQHNSQLRQEVIIAYGSKCVCCGENDWHFLTIDHIAGNGQQDRKQFTGGFYRNLKRRGWPKKGLQLLCANCNCAKWWFEECPHNNSSPS